MSIEVRPLEWRNVDASPQSDDWWFEASTPFGNYTVTFIEEHTLPWLLEPFRSNLASNYATEDEAMSAGAADYAARIRSAIHPAPSRGCVVECRCASWPVQSLNSAKKRRPACSFRAV